MLDWLARKFEQRRSILHGKFQRILNENVEIPVKAVEVDWIKLGNQALNANNLPDAEKYYREALNIAPREAGAYVNLGFVKLQQKEFDEARTLLKYALEIDPENFDAWYILGGIHEIENDFAAAIELYRKVIVIKPDFNLAYHDCGRLLQLGGQRAEALEVVKSGIAHIPNETEFYLVAGILQLGLGQLADAISSYESAMLLEPESPEPYINMVSAMISMGDYAGAVEHGQIAVQLNPSNSLAHDNLGAALLYSNQTQQAIEAFEQALLVEPRMTSAIGNLGSAYLSRGNLDLAISHSRRALSHDPMHVGATSNLLFALNYHPELTAETIYEDYKKFNETIGVPLQKMWRPHVNAAAGHRKLRVGYVSPDFRRHSVMQFMEPILTCHDKSAFELYAYAEVMSVDEVTARVKNIVSHWRSTVGMTDAAVVQMIRDDQIDILVDLAGHTGGNRLRVFACKPAPVSVSWIGYGYTTGLTAIDYYLTDAINTPLGSEHLFSEKPWRMSRPPYVYRPNPAMGVVGTLPAIERGFVTFCTLTRPVRVNQRVVRAWADILKRVPNSRLVVDSKSYSDEVTREGLIEQFQSIGIDRDRLDIGYHSPPWDLMRSVDISLDCFPHNSGTTLFESLYMGVPFITLEGRPSVGRLGATILHGVGHPEWIATSEEEYVELAVSLAADVNRLAHYRVKLRDEMEQSTLLDEAGFTRALEEAYRKMFDIWKCGK